MNTSIPVISRDAFRGRIEGVIYGEDCGLEDSYKESNDEAEESERSYPPMLQWTTRLRDFLEEGGYESDPRTWQHVREAEFICHAHQSKNDENKDSSRKCKSSSAPTAVEATDSATFPQEFDFHVFWGCFNRIAYLPLDIFPPNSGIHQRMRQPQNDRGKPVDWFQHDVSLMWLSPTVFISNAEISWTSPKNGHRNLLWIYTVTLEMRPASGSQGIRSIYIYCLEYFHKRKRNKPPPPLLPLSFFRHMVSRLPVDFFAAIAFTEGTPMFSPSFYSTFLASVLPTAEEARPPVKTKNYQDYTEIRFPDKMTSPTLKMILEHPFHPYVRLVFDQLDDTSLDIDRVNLMLRNSSNHLRHLKVPTFLVKYVPEDDESFAANPRLETLTMDWATPPRHREWRDAPPGWNNTGVSPAILDGIRRNPNFQRLNLRFALPGITRPGFDGYYQFMPPIQENLTCLLDTVIPKHPSFKELTVNIKTDWDETYDALCAEGINCLIANWRSLGTSLCHLSFTHECMERHEPGWDPDEKKNLPLWDLRVAPGLLTNWLFFQSPLEQRHESPPWALSKQPAQRAKRAPRQPAASLLALQIRAINEGILYRKTTEQLPHDMSAANATVMHVLVHRVLVEVEDAAVL
jgi:hypothetical protein